MGTRMGQPYTCTVAVMSSVADMSSDVIGFTEPIISCVLSNNTQHKTSSKTEFRRGSPRKPQYLT